MLNVKRYSCTGCYRKSGFIKTSLFLLFILSFCIVGYANDVYTIKNDYPVGKYILTQESNKTMVLSYLNVSRMAKSRFFITWDVEIDNGPKDSQKTLVMKVIRMTISDDSGDPAVRAFFFDSDDRFSTKKNKLMAVYNIFLKSSFTIILNNNGTLEKVDGLDAMWKEMEKLNDPDSKVYISTLKNVVTEKTFAEAFTQLNYVLPSKPVILGEKWESKTSLEFPVVGNINLLWNNTLTNVMPTQSGRCANVESSADVTLENINASLDFKVTSTYNLDLGVNQEFNSETNFRSVKPTQDEGVQINQSGVIRCKQKLMKR